jgi:hypothetical protein
LVAGGIWTTDVGVTGSATPSTISVPAPASTYSISVSLGCWCSGMLAPAGSSISEADRSLLEIVAGSA